MKKTIMVIRLGLKGGGLLVGITKPIRVIGGLSSTF